VIIFVFEKSDGADWILSTKKRDILKSNFTVSWIVDLPRKDLIKHSGLPMINSGEKEIRKTLSIDR
jgi:hypothetical protein